METYQIEQVKSNVWIIRELYAEDSALVLGLVVGEEKAALIDSGMGVFGEDLKDVVASLTDKPIVNLLTHGHPDHIGGSVLFQEVYMNRRDEDQIPRLAQEQRLRDVNMFSHNDPAVFAYAVQHCLDCSGFQYRPLEDGQLISLGGVNLEVIALPGHSQGSVAFFNQRDHYCFVGDAFGDSIPASSVKSLESFREMASAIEAFTRKVPENTALFGGHWKKPLNWVIIRDEMNCALELSQQAVEGDEDIYMPISPVPHQKKHSHGSVWISYNPAILNLPDKKAERK